MAMKTPLRWLLSAACAVSVGGLAAPAAPIHSRTPPAQPSAMEGTYPELTARLERLGQMLAQTTDAGELGGLQMQQAEVMIGLAILSHGEEQISWLRQASEGLHDLARTDPRFAKSAHDRLLSLEAQVSAMMPGTSIAAHVAYDEMEAGHWAHLNGGVEDSRAKEEWRTLLAHFVKQYPNTDQTPAAMMELAQLSEKLDHDKDALVWFQRVAAEFPEDPQASRASGAARRLEMPGHTFYLALPKVEDLNEPFDVDQLRGKMVVVYFWASTDAQSIAGFQELKKILSRYDGVMELVTVSLDGTPGAAANALQANAVPGVHLFQRGGLQGRIVTRYGLTAVPTAVLLDLDGKVGVTSVGGLEQAIGRLQR